MLLLVCEHLLDNGALPSYTDADGNHALLLAVQYRKGAQLVGKLLAKALNFEFLIIQTAIIQIINP
jgi:hypothetical protein